MSFETVLYEVQDRIATITLNRPDKLNAINAQLEHDLREAMHTADRSDEIRVIILTGSGRGFCAGADMSVLNALGEKDWSSSTEEPSSATSAQTPGSATSAFQTPHSYFPAISKPIIGAINGAAVGLGFVYPLYCDIRFASDSARFGTAFAQRGLIAEHGASWMLPRLIGISQALDLLYSARLIGAQEALQLGLVNRVVAGDKLMDEVREYAGALATKVSPRSLRVIKRQVYEAQFQDLHQAIEMADVEMRKSFRCADFKEGIAHFLEKRAPQFIGK